MKQFILLSLTLLSLLSGIYSGFLKSCGFGDIVVLLNLCLFIIIVGGFLFKGKFVLSESYMIFFSFLLILISLNIVSISYTPSQNYIVKFINLFYLILVFLTPWVLINIYNICFEKIMNYWLYFIMLYMILFVIYLFNVGLQAYFILFKEGLAPDYLLLAKATYPISFYLMFFQSNKKLKIASLLMLIPIVYLGGRAPFVAFCLISLSVILFDNKMKINKIYFVISSFIFLSFAFLMGFFDTIIARFTNLDNDISLLTRYKEYGSAFESIKQNIFFGTGISSSGIVLGYGDIFAYPHNLFLEVWLEIGLFPAILFLLVLCHAIYIYFNSFKRNNQVVVFLTSMIIFFFINAMKSESYTGLRYLFFFYGIYFSYSYYLKKELSLL